MAFQIINYNSVDFQMISDLINNNNNNNNNNINNNKVNTRNSFTDSLELVKLYKLSFNNNNTNINNNNDNNNDINDYYTRVFTIITPKKLSDILNFGWDHLKESFLFSSDAGYYQLLLLL